MYFGNTSKLFIRAFRSTCLEGKVLEEGKRRKGRTEHYFSLELRIEFPWKLCLHSFSFECLADLSVEQYLIRD